MFSFLFGVCVGGTVFPLCDFYFIIIKHKYIYFWRDRAKVTPPRIELGTSSVLTRCHNQLDHGVGDSACLTWTWQLELCCCFFFIFFFFFLFHTLSHLFIFLSFFLNRWIIYIYFYFLNKKTDNFYLFIYISPHMCIRSINLCELVT